jgi:hypothetical protein
MTKTAAWLPVAVRHKSYRGTIATLGIKNGAAATHTAASAWAMGISTDDGSNETNTDLFSLFFERLFSFQFLVLAELPGGTQGRD